MVFNNISVNYLKMNTFKFWLKLFIFCALSGIAVSEKTLHVKYLEPGIFIQEKQPSNVGFRKSSLQVNCIYKEIRYSHTNFFQIYCYSGKSKYLVNFFNTIALHLDIEDTDFTQYEGNEPAAVEKAYKDHRSIFSFNFLSSKKKLITLNPFNQSCIGIEAASPYSVRLSLLRVDFWRVLLFTAGLFIFFFAASLSNNAVFYYITGILLGIFASLLICIYMVSKFIPRKPMMYGAMIGGWTLSLYFGQMILENIRFILVTHQMYVFWYVLASGLISFIVCYRMGPPKNQRSKNLIRWGLQLGALFLIFYSSHFQEASAGANVSICLIYYFPKKIITKSKLLWRRKFPEKRKLLTSEEFYEQGVLETTKALNELRQYCSSPESKPWRTMLKLKNPSRFASFIEGDSHLRDDEMLDFETSRDQIDSDDESSASSEDKITINPPNLEISDDEDGDNSVPPPIGWAYDTCLRGASLPHNKFLRSTPVQNYAAPQRSTSRQTNSPPNLNKIVSDIKKRNKT